MHRWLDWNPACKLPRPGFGLPRGTAGLQAFQRIDSAANQAHSQAMKTILEIPERELKDAVRFTKAKTKREAVIIALTDFNRRNRMAELVKHSGTSDTFMTNEEIEALEGDEPSRRA